MIPGDLIYGHKVSVILGELIGRYTNDYIMNVSIKRNKGVFEAESRLWYGLLLSELSS